MKRVTLETFVVQHLTEKSLLLDIMKKKSIKDEFLVITSYCMILIKFRKKNRFTPTHFIAYSRANVLIIRVKKLNATN